MPPLFMSANWFSEKQMTELFVAGLQQGVRGFDTAREYGVEAMVGRALKIALKETGVKREEIFIQTRISNEELIRGNVRDDVYRSIESMRFDYIDAFMFHWPTPDYYISAWKQLEQVYKGSNIIRYVGMCNCRQRHLEKMELENIEIMPQILQVEVTPFWQIKELKAYCDKRNIVIQAFSPLCKMIQPIKDNAVLKRIAENHHSSIAQVVLRWHQQRGIAPISMTSKVSRVKENFSLSGLKLTDAEMAEIGALDCGYKYHLESATCVGF